MELHERLHSLAILSGGGDVKLAAPEGFAPRVIVRGRYNGAVASGPIDLRAVNNGTGSGAGDQSFGGHLRVVGGKGGAYTRSLLSST